MWPEAAGRWPDKPPARFIMPGTLAPTCSGLPDRFFVLWSKTAIEVGGRSALPKLCTGSDTGAGGSRSCQLVRIWHYLVRELGVIQGRQEDAKMPTYHQTQLVSRRLPERVTRNDRARDPVRDRLAGEFFFFLGATGRRGLVVNRNAQGQGGPRVASIYFDNGTGCQVCQRPETLPAHLLRKQTRLSMLCESY